MNVDASSLPENAADLKAIVISLAASHAGLKEKEQTYQSRIEYLEERIRLLQNELFGRKTEKLPPEDRDQLPLFNEVEIEKEARDNDVSDGASQNSGHTEEQNYKKKQEVCLCQEGTI